MSQDDVLRSGGAGRKVIHGSALRVGASVMGLVLGLGTATILLRHLGVDESGRYVTVLSLIGIAVAVVDTGLNQTGTSALAQRPVEERPELLANVISQRLLVAPIALVLLVAFALVAGYPKSMVLGTLLAGSGLLIVAIADAVLLPLTVELRNAGMAVTDFLRQAVTLVGVAILAAAGAGLVPFFAVQIAVGLSILAICPALLGRGRLVMPRFDRSYQRVLFATALPIATALALGQVYFRFVIVLMSLISSSTQTGYFGGSLRAMEALIVLPVLVASVALPVLSAAARDENHARLRYAIEGLGEGAVIAGVFIILVTIRAAEPVMKAIGGTDFGPAGDVLRIQVVALLFVALYQIWTVSLIALKRQHDLILTNAVALLGVAVFAFALVPPLGARGGAIASVLGDILLAGLILWRLRRQTGVVVRFDFLLRVLGAALAGAVVLAIPEIPDLLAAALSGVVFLVVGHFIGMVPPEVRAAVDIRRVDTATPSPETRRR